MATASPLPSKTHISILLSLCADRTLMIWLRQATPPCTLQTLTTCQYQLSAGHSRILHKERSACQKVRGSDDMKLDMAQTAVQVPIDKKYDMYEKQFAAFLHAVRTGDQKDVRCLFRDAARTYAASWWITEAAGSPSPDGSVPE